MPRDHRSLTTIVALLLLSTPLAASDSAEAVGEATETDVPPILAEAPGVPLIPRTTAEITADGVLDEPGWRQAYTTTLDYETRPGENIEAKVDTVAYFLYDTRALYVAFEAHDPEPEKIRARYADRDTAWSDDFIGIVIDTFNDERRAYEFFVNPYGVQMDLFNDEVNNNETASWDAIWDSGGRITDDGYVVEMVIPFTEIGFPRTENAMIWGLDAVRFWPRDHRYRISNNVLDRDIDCYLCQASKVQGFQGIDPGRNLEIVPSLVGGRRDERSDLHQPIEEGDAEAEVGLTAKWGFTPNLTLSGTINPDFSQVEADAGRLDLNETFALFFPERRPFFLEGADFFDTPFNVIFTRNVADPNWGGKVTGKEGRHVVASFVAEDDVTNIIFPGSQGSDAGSFDHQTTAATARYRYDIGSNASTVGMVTTNREGGGYFNRVGGIDGRYRFNDQDSITFQGLASSTQYPDDVADDYDQPEGVFEDYAFRVDYRHDARNLSWRASYRDIGTDFRADLGFMPRVDYRLGIVGMNYTWWGEEESFWSRISLGGDVDRTEDQSGQLLEQEYELFFNISMPRQSFLFLGPGTRERYWDGVIYDESYLNFFFEMQATPIFFFYLDGTVGDRVDFANSRPGELIDLEPFVRFDMGRHLRATLSHNYRTLDVEGGQLFEANLSRLRLVYQINLRMFVRAIFEYTDIARNPDLYIDEVDASTEDLFTQLLFSYKINPRTVAFLGYDDTMEADDSVDSLTRSNRGVFLKLSYAFKL